MKKTNIKDTILPLIIWGLSVIFYFYVFLLQVSPSVMVHTLMHDFSVDATVFNYLALAYFLIYSVAQIPVGLLTDRFNTRYLLAFASAICGIGCLMFATSHAFSEAIFARILIAAGAAFATVCCFNLAAEWFPPKRFAMMAGITITIAMCGAIFGTAPLAWLLRFFGWRNTIKAFAFTGIILSILSYLIIRDKPTTHKHKQQHEPVLVSLKYLLRSKQNWLTSVYSGLMYAPTLIFGSTWGIPYLMRTYDISKPEAGWLVTFLFIGWIVGSPLAGWISDLIVRRKTPIVIGTICSFISFGCIVYIPNLPKLVLIVLLFAFGLFSSSLLIAFSIIRDINPTKHRATALGFINTLNNVACVPIYPIIGIILDKYGHSLIRNGFRIFSVTSYRLAFSVILALILISLLLLPFIKETFCHSFHED